ncbi:MAG: hypothetical protein IPP47_04825 [Bryobacterales bacterium]|nr:hypothetical protein [Bryobacterales bacterium]
MRPHYLNWMMAVGLVAQPVCAAAQPEQAMNWAQLRQEIARQKLIKRTVKVHLASGPDVKATLRGMDDDSIVVNANRQTSKRWKATAASEARIPRSEVTGLEFQGRRGKKGLIGGLVGLGVGLGMVVVASALGEHGVNAPTDYLVILLPAGPIAGYLIGHYADAPLPNVRIVP